MAESSILKEFLVALGFQIRDQDKFEASVARATKQVKAMATAIEAAFASAALAATEVGARMQDLYYASKKFGDSANDVQAWVDSMHQVGASTQEAYGQLNTLQNFISNTPGSANIAKAFGLDGEHGAVGLARSLSREISRMGTADIWRVRARYGMFLGGMSDDDIRELGRNPGKNYAGFEAQFKNQGVDFDKLSAQGRQFQADWTRLLDTIAPVADKLVVNVLMPVVQAVVGFAQTLDKLTGGFSTTLIVIAGAAAAFFKVVLPLVNAFGNIGRIVGPLAEILPGAAEGAEGLGAAFVAINPELWPIIGIIAAIVAGIIGLIEAFKHLQDIKNFGHKIAQGIRDALPHVKQAATEVAHTVAKAAAPTVAAVQRAAVPVVRGARSAVSQAAAALGIDGVVAQIEQDEGFRSQAYIDKVGKGHPWTVGFGATGSGIGAGTVWTRGQAEADLRRRVGVVADQLRRALPWFSSLDQARQGALENMAYNLGVGGLLKFHRSLADMQRGDFGAAAHDFLQSKWARQVHGRANRIAALIGGGGPALISPNLTANITINGATDPHATAKQVHGAVTRAYGDMVRQALPAAT